MFINEFNRFNTHYPLFIHMHVKSSMVLKVLKGCLSSIRKKCCSHPPYKNSSHNYIMLGVDEQ